MTAFAVTFSLWCGMQEVKLGGGFLAHRVRVQQLQVKAIAL
jgi:hypothetical protein